MITYPAVTTRVHTSEWVPSPPLHVKAGCYPSNTRSHDISGSCWVKWDRPRQPNGRLVAYELYYKRMDRTNPQVLKHNVDWAQPKTIGGKLFRGYDSTITELDLDTNGSYCPLCPSC